MSGVDERFLASFADDAGERIDRIVDTLLALERGEAAPAGLAELFREVHSVKGGAGMMGLDDVHDVAHAIENVLGVARQAGDLPQPLVGPLLAATDALRRSVHGEKVDVAAVTGALSGGEQGPVASPPDETTTVPAAPAPAPDAVSTDRRSLRVDAAKVDRLLDAVGEAVLHHRRIEHTLTSGGAEPDEQLRDDLDWGETLVGDLQDAVLELRTLPLSSITDRLPRAVRDLAIEHGKEVEMRVTGADVQLDRSVIEGLSEPLVHLIRNAVAHGIETPSDRERAGKPPGGRIDVHAEQHGDRIAIELTDDGRGVARELLERASGRQSLAEVLAEPGMSTSDGVGALAGRGVGLDAVKSHVEALGGSIEVRSDPGRGTAVRLLLPVTLALVHVLLVERAGIVLGVPLGSIAEAITLSGTTSLGGQPSVEVRGRVVPVVDLIAVVGFAPAPLPDGAPALVLDVGGDRIAVGCDRLVDEQEVVLKALGPLLTGVPGYLGAAVLGDGRVALIADPAFIARASRERHAPQAPESLERAAPRILVVDDQFTVRELQRSILEAAGYRVLTARDGVEADEMLNGDGDVDAVVTDVEMPRMNGIELIRAIRRRPEQASLPIVVVTSRGGEEDEQRGLESGADAYIVKDRFDQQALLDTVQRLVGR